LVKSSNGDKLRDTNTLVDLHQVVKVYESPAGKYLALKGIDLQVDKGEFVAVVGKSGSGKSTLMNMITGIDHPTTGEIIVANVGIHKLSEGKIAVWRGRTIGIVFQFFQLLPTLSVIENIMLPMDFCHMYSLRERRTRANYLLELVDLADQANKLPSTLSGGQQQRVAIARSLANDPPIIVADEPTGNLDSKTASSIFELFEELVNDGKTIVMVTHDQDMARKVSRTIYLVDGRIVGEDEFSKDRDGIKADIKTTVSEQEIIEKTGETAELSELRFIVSEILDNPQDAVIRLRTEVFPTIPENGKESDPYLQVILEEINFRAKQAEQSGNTKEAKLYWQILMEATE